ncbi:MAG: hypothetical protein ACI4TK_18220 [Agathobacter sp.]
MYIQQIMEAMEKVKSHMSSPDSLPVRSVDALREEVEFVNGVKYSLRTGERIF